MIILKKDDWIIRHLTKEDQSVLVKWLSDPRVLEFYEGRDNPFDETAVRKEFLDVEDHLERCIIIYKNKRIGYIQIYPLDEETKKLYGVQGDRLFGVDQFIGETDYWNQGLGTRLISMMADHLLNEYGAEQVYMDPQRRNPRALRAYEKAGFKKVKLLPHHELHEGVYEDCWLIVYP